MRFNRNSIPLEDNATIIMQIKLKAIWYFCGI